MTEMLSVANVIIAMEGAESLKQFSGIAKKRSVMNQFKSEDAKLVNDIVELIICLKKNTGLINVNQRLWKRLKSCCS